MKTKYILHGGYSLDNNVENRKFFEECFNDITQDSQVLIVLFASDNRTNSNLYQDLVGKMLSASGKELMFEKADRETFLDQVKRADLIYLEGGDTNRLLTALEQYQDLGPLFKGKIVVGSSAGVYVLAMVGTSHDEVHTRKGLGILPLRIVCHYESEKLPPSATSLKEIQSEKEDLELVLLRDYEYKVYVRN